MWFDDPRDEVHERIRSLQMERDVAAQRHAQIAMLDTVRRQKASDAHQKGVLKAMSTVWQAQEQWPCRKLRSTNGHDIRGLHAWVEHEKEWADLQTRSTELHPSAIPWPPTLTRMLELMANALLHLVDTAAGGDDCRSLTACMCRSLKSNGRAHKQGNGSCISSGLSAKGSGSSKNRLEGSDRDEFNTHMFQQRQLVAMRYAYKKAALRWHPDKFMARVAHTQPQVKRHMSERVGAIFAAVHEQWREHLRGGEGRQATPVD